MTFPWADDHISHLRKRWTEDGATAATIAEELGEGLTRNAVLGKAHRLGLPSHARTTPKGPASVLKHKRLKRSASKPPPVKQLTVENSVMKDDCFNAFARPTVELMQLKTGMCRWPYGDRPFRYCGERTKNPFDPECPYCPGHTRLAYGGSESLVEDREDVKEAA